MAKISNQVAIKARTSGAVDSIRLDPTVLSANERNAEFARVIFRAIERKVSQGTHIRIPEAVKTATISTTKSLDS